MTAMDPGPPGLPARTYPPAMSGPVDHREHSPSRPSWDCATCGQPWPCPPARVQLGEQYGTDRVGLAMEMGTLLVDACREMPKIPPREAYERFVSWTR